ncbi:MAG: hypothetical protein UMU76_09620 [Prosthecochloris sp.]|nr:hypothetical protein [Prosthecochloris sp.]
MAADDFGEIADEPNYNNPNTSPDPPSPYADLEKKYRKNKFNKKKNSYYPELYGTSGVDISKSTKASGNKSQKKRSQKSRRKASSRAGRQPQGR